MAELKKPHNKSLEYTSSWPDAAGLNLRLLMRRRYLYLLAIFIFSGCSICGNDPLHVDSPPAGDKVAVSFVRDCGATTGHSTHVSIVDASGGMENEPGNVFIVEGKRPISVGWDADNHLVVAAGGAGEVFKKLGEFDGIKIEYR